MFSFKSKLMKWGKILRTTSLSRKLKTHLLRLTMRIKEKRIQSSMRLETIDQALRRSKIWFLEKVLSFQRRAYFKEKTRNEASMLKEIMIVQSLSKKERRTILTLQSLMMRKLLLNLVQRSRKLLKSQLLTIKCF